MEGVQKTEKKIEKNFKNSILNIIYELCQHLGSLRSLWKAPETQTLGGRGGIECRHPLAK